MEQRPDRRAGASAEAVEEADVWSSEVRSVKSESVVRRLTTVRRAGEDCPVIIKSAGVPSQFHPLIHEMKRVIDLQMKKELFMRIPQGKAGYYNQQELFGAQVNSNF